MMSSDELDWLLYAYLEESGPSTLPRVFARVPRPTPLGATREGSGRV